MKKNSILAIVSVLALAIVLSISNRKADAANLIVDDNLACPSATFTSISAAVGAASAGDTISVCAGTYNENVNIPAGLTGLTLNGAQAGNAVGGRTFGGAGESTLTGQITIQATGVTVDGLSLTNPGQAFGIVVKTAGDNAVIQNNIIDTVGAATLAGGGGAQGVYLELGPDNVSVVDNAIRNISSIGSAKGVLIGDTSSTNWAMNVLIEGNTIENITSIRGAYAIQINNGAARGGTSPKPQTASTTAEIRDNNIRNLSGGWVHAVGLEGDTPGAIVEGNCFSSFTSPGLDKSAVFFEFNPGAVTTEVHQNRFDLTAADIGIGLHPFNQPAVVVDGENNWWGNPSGPTTPSNPGGTGAKVSPTVDYTPWLVFPPAGGACGNAIATNKDQCKNGGWQTVVRANGSPFKNQGDCIQYVNTGK